MRKIDQESVARINSLFSGMAANLSNLSFKTREAIEALQDFGDAMQLATDTQPAQIAKEVAEAAISRANLGAKSV